MTLTDVVVITGASNQHLTFQAGCPSCHPTNSVRALKVKSVSLHGLAHPKLTSSNIVLGPQKDPGHLGGGSSSLRSASDASIPLVKVQVVPNSKQTYSYRADPGPRQSALR